ncbi:MAG: hypothetical protein MUC42_00900 [Bryobacter sp.]|nr:hypothetical protein [Bryobacter sp.]
MKRWAVLFIAVATVAWADKTNPTESEIQEIIKNFAAKETEFSRARENYTYRQSSRIQELFSGGGKWEEIWDIVFGMDGKRAEKVVNAPTSSLKALILTPEDMEDLRNTQPFVLTSKDIDLYHVRYLGKYKLDVIECFLFAVKPKKMVQGKRYFDGQIWVDDQDLQIVKSFGRGVGLLKKGSDQKFPKFETFRQQIDDKYWFPVYTVANDTLMFQSGPIPIKMTVRYENYKQFKSDINIKYGDVVDGPSAAGSGPQGPQLAPPLAPKKPTPAKKP